MFPLDVEQPVDAASLAWEWGAVAIAVAAALAAAFVCTWVLGVIMRTLGRRRQLFTRLSRRLRSPLFWTILSVGLWVATTQPLEQVAPALAGAIRYALKLASIITIGWLIASILLFLVDGLLARSVPDGDADYTLRRRRTQILIIRRLVIVVVVVLTAGTILMTIPGAESFGTSLLASAGVASIVAGIAAQSTLGNVVAGMQLAFSDALRVGDTVEVDGEFGVVEELTLTYVVVQIWDDRRLVLPSTYFTTTPYANWTRSQTQLTGVVLIDVDWGVDLDGLRAELQRVVESAPSWDGRSAGLVMVDARADAVQVRATVTAANSGDLWDLRCLVRERLVAYVSRRGESLPARRVRVEERGDERALEQNPARAHEPADRSRGRRRRAAERLGRVSRRVARRNLEG
ncbi:mechanosensitive ion channel [Microbacterium oryzae]|uniref:mechanosensitive ion channel family protein n=1 Tax=Microbacterium oryzae TaxID=743009 RepID=UPI0025AFCB67|nr:mechanosensitive ion channel domain-containing protein [Microbacterium oryzae]MDN3311574.1 mechanosensitive ion channel [Microbacterium oryzae]